jgi:hypothetical protein
MRCVTAEKRCLSHGPVSCLPTGRRFSAQSRRLFTPQRHWLSRLGANKTSVVSARLPCGVTYRRAEPMPGSVSRPAIRQATTTDAGEGMETPTKRQA